MWHSVKEIGERRESLSRKRNDEKLFVSDDFLNFAKENVKKYDLIVENNTLKVNTWNSDDLIDDFKRQL